MKKYIKVIIFLGFVLRMELVGGFVHRNLVNDNSAGTDKKNLNEIASHDDSDKHRDKLSLAEQENTTEKGEEPGLIFEKVTYEKLGDTVGNDSEVLEKEEPDVIDNGTCVCVDKGEEIGSDEKDGSGGASGEQIDETGKGQSREEGGSGGEPPVNAGGEHAVIDVDKPGAEIGETGEESDLETNTQIDEKGGQEEIAKKEGDDGVFTFSPLDR